ncbi:Complex I assembly factor ACAD9, mitochondrial [Halotydeus destructor]|nr:Complex I assembly factor ACAD9, mitochondrial [Halotydeus destructor]
MKSGLPVSTSSVNPIFTNDSVKTITQLIIQNCIIRKLMGCADNRNLADKVSSMLDSKPDMKIGYAFSERNANLGVSHFREWESEAESLNDGTWLISGTKSCILDAEYDYYAVFCKTLDYETDIEFPADYERPFGMVGFLLPKEVIEKIETTEEHGIKYQTITFPDLTLSAEEAELLKPDLKATKALNCKGVGQLAVAAMICGQIKSSAQTYFDFLATDSRDLLNQQILESHFADITGKIYALESISYMTAAMHDSYVEGSSDLHLESAIAKTVATESAYDIYNRLQALYGSKYLVTSPMADIVKLYDGFLEGSIFNRMLVGLHGAQFYGAYRNDDIHKRSLLPFFPSYFFTDWFKWRKQEKDEPKLDMGLKKYFRSDFGQHAEMLEYCIKRMEFAADKVVFRWAKDSPNHQIDMWRLGLIAEEVFKLTCMLSRASRTVSESHMDCDAEMYVAKNAVRQSWVKVKDLVWECEYSPYLTGDKRNETIHSKNSKYGGYFAYSPLDRVVY